MSNIIYRQVGRDAHYKIWHKPEKNTFILIQSGNGSLVSRDKSYPMTRGALCFIGNHKYHYTYPDVPEQYIRSKLFISSEDLEKIVQLLYPHQELTKILDEHQIAAGLLDEHSYQRAEEIFEELSRLQTNAAYFQAKFYSAILSLTVLLSQNTSKKIPHHFGNMQIAVEYINHHITEDINIDQICAASYMSKYYFCRLFKKKIGVTVMEYVQKTRIAMAKELLSESNMSVTEIAEACGFSSISYFSRSFKNETSVTPSQYKRSKL